MANTVEQDEGVETVRRQLEEAERGKGGLKRIPSRDFLRLTNEQKKTILTEPVILTSDDEDILVIMTVEDYFARIPPRAVSGRVARMVIEKGVLYRECI